MVHCFRTVDHVFRSTLNYQVETNHTLTLDEGDSYRIQEHPTHCPLAWHIQHHLRDVIDPTHILLASLLALQSWFRATPNQDISTWYVSMEQVGETGRVHLLSAIRSIVAYSTATGGLG